MTGKTETAPMCRYCRGDGFEIICNNVPAHRYNCGRIEFIGSDYDMGQTQECRNAELKSVRRENRRLRGALIEITGTAHDAILEEMNNE